MTSVFFTQGTVMNLSVGNFTLPVASLNVFNCTYAKEVRNRNLAVGIVVLVPLFDRLIYPYLKSRGIEFGQLKRICSGFLFGALGMIYAGRKHRLKNKVLTIYSTQS